MRLRDLNATFVGRYRHEDGHIVYSEVPSLEGAQGISFQCPICAVGKVRGQEGDRRFVRGAHHITCWFRNPRGARPVPIGANPKPGRWWVSASSTSLDDLTFEHGEPPLPKSIQLLAGCNWHGYIEQGNATPPDGSVESLTLTAKPMETNEQQTDEQQQAAFARSARIEALIAEGKTQDEALAIVDLHPDQVRAFQALALTKESEPAIDLEEPPREEEELEPERIDSVTVKVRAIAPGYDGLKFREKGDVFPLTLVRGRTAPSWVELAEG